jgi:hypothetical protein
VYVYPFPPTYDFDFIYRFPYGVYPYSHNGYPYPYPPYSYPYPGCVTVSPETEEAHGGIRLDVPQKDATVVVDGFYVGVVEEFDDDLHHLDLPPGPHHLELQAPGYQTLAFDVNVQPGQTIRYRSSMRPIEPPL